MKYFYKCSRILGLIHKTKTRFMLLITGGLLLTGYVNSQISYALKTFGAAGSIDSTLASFL